MEHTRLKSSAHWLISMVCTSPPTIRVSSQLPTLGDFSNSLLVLEKCSVSLRNMHLMVSPPMSIRSPSRRSTLFSVQWGTSICTKQSHKHVGESWLPLASCVTLSDLTFLNLFFICKIGIILCALQGSKEIKWGNPYNVINLLPDTNRHLIDASFFPYPGWEWEVNEEPPCTEQASRGSHS